MSEWDGSGQVDLLLEAKADTIAEERRGPSAILSPKPSLDLI